MKSGFDICVRTLNNRGLFRGQALASDPSTLHKAAMSPAPPPIATPCVRVCFVDAESGLCLGCHRTTDEIADWSRLSDADRHTIMAGLTDRKSLIRPEKLGRA